MTEHDIPQDDILEAARRLTDGRMNAVRALVDSIKSTSDVEAELAAKVAEAQATLNEAQARHRAAFAKVYNDAVKAGWTEGELRKVGIVGPGKKPRKAPRPRGRARSEAERAPASHLVRTGIEREARASIELDRDETHVIGEPAA